VRAKGRVRILDVWSPGRGEQVEHLSNTVNFLQTCCRGLIVHHVQSRMTGDTVLFVPLGWSPSFKVRNVVELLCTHHHYGLHYQERYTPHWQPTSSQGTHRACTKKQKVRICIHLIEQTTQSGTLTTWHLLHSQDLKPSTQVGAKWTERPEVRARLFLFLKRPRYSRACSSKVFRVSNQLIGI